MADYEAVKVPLDPTPAQERMFRMYAGAARFAYNAALAHMKEQLDERKAQIEAGVAKKDLVKIDNNVVKFGYWWRANRDTLAPWWPEVASQVQLRVRQPRPRIRQLPQKPIRQTPRRPGRIPQIQTARRGQGVRVQHYHHPGRARRETATHRPRPHIAQRRTAGGRTRHQNHDDPL